MNFFQRAIKNVLRTPTKSILLALTFFVIGNLVIVGLGISSASENAKILTRKQMRAIVEYEVDYTSYYNYVDSLESEEERTEAYKHYPSLNAQTVAALAKDERVKAVNNFSNWVTFYGYELNYVPNPYADSDSNDLGYITDEEGNSYQYESPGFQIKANSYPSQIEIEEGTYTIKEGHFYTQEDIDEGNPVCLITDELAEADGLSVGDKIKLSQIMPSQISMYMENVNGKTEDDFLLELEIIGIYNNSQTLDPNDSDTKYKSAYEVPANIILMPSTTYANYNYDIYLIQRENNIAKGYISASDEASPKETYTSSKSAVFLLSDPLDVEQFVEDYEDSIDEYTKLDANNDTFNKLARPLDTLSFFSNIIVLIVVFNAIVIISLVTALTLKNRSFEIGVLLSIGVSKLKIVTQLFIELVVVSLLGFTLAVGTGSLIAGYVGKMVLEYQATSEEKYTSDSDSNTYYSSSSNYFTEVTSEDLYAQYEVKIGPVIILEIYVLGLAVTFISIVIPSVMIMRYNPKQILMSIG